MPNLNEELVRALVEELVLKGLISQKEKIAILSKFAETLTLKKC